MDLFDDELECRPEGDTILEKVYVSPEKVVAPFLKTLKRRKITRADVVKEEFEEFYLRAKPHEILARLNESFTDPVKMATVLNETAELLRVATSSKSVNLYLTDYDNNNITLCPRFVQDESYHIKYEIAPGHTLAAYVAFVREYVITGDILGDSRFPEGIPGTDLTVKAALCIPVLSNASGKCIAVIELYRDFRQPVYDTVSLQICTALCGWVGIGIEENCRAHSVSKEVEIHRYLLSVAQLLFQGILNFNKAISDVIVFSKAAVKASKCSFFLMDQPVHFGSTEKIYAQVYEEALDNSKGLAVYKKKTKACFQHLKPGEVGYSARSGEVILIKDAYNDARFDQSSDSINYRTRSLAVIPIKNTLGTIGVLRFSNKLTGPFFTQEDVKVLEVFADYAALLCAYEYLSQTNRQQGLKLDIARNLLFFHTKAPREDLDALKTLPVLYPVQMPPSFFSIDWNGDTYEDEMPKYVLFAFLGADVVTPRIIHSYLASFTLSVKKAYRSLPYHNFAHAFIVFHFLFIVISRNRDKFSAIEIVSLLIAGLCHGLDHYGLTNSFLELKNEAVARLYDEFPQEEHNFQVCLLLIEANNLLSEFSNDEYQEIIREIRMLILSKNITFFFRHKREMVSLINSELFQWDNPEHRYLMKVYLMTCAEYSWNYRTFDFIQKSADNFYRELYAQGDMEKAMGLAPISMMDRAYASLIPNYHLTLLKTIVDPCTRIVAALFPNCQEIIDLYRDGVEKWNELVDMRSVEIWKPEESYVKEKKSRSARNTIGSISPKSV